MKRLEKVLGTIVVLIGMLFLLNSSAVYAESGLYPNIIKYDEIKTYAVIPVRDDVLVVDSRPAKRRYEVGHIPGAISLPDTQFDKLTTLLPEDKNQKLIFYCGGLKCKLSHKSAFKAEALGYTNIAVYADGMPDWEAKGEFVSVGASYVKKVLDKQTATVFDVRPLKRKYAKAHVPGALSLPNTQFDKLTHLLPGDKAAEVIFYCGGPKCPLSVKSATKAKALGYTNVKLFQPGYPAWKAAYGPGVKGNEPYEAAAATDAGKIEVGEDGDTITIDSLKAILSGNPDSIYIYDVRDPEEYERAHMAIAKNQSVEDLEDEYGTLPTDKPIVFICTTGSRSGEAYDIVKMLDPDREVYFLDAEMTFHADGAYDIEPH